MMQFDIFFHTFFLSMSPLENATLAWGQHGEIRHFHKVPRPIVSSFVFQKMK